MAITQNSRDVSTHTLSLLIPVLLLVAGCGGRGPTFDYSLQGADAVCSGGTEGPVGVVRPNRYILGNTSNAIRRTEDVFWIVQSGSNSVGRLHVRTGSYSSTYIDVGENRGPYDIAVDLESSRAFVTNWRSNSITVADTRNGGRVAEFGEQGLANPQGIAVTDNYVYVTNVEYRPDQQQRFGPGHVTILERGNELSLVGTVQTAAKNPQFARKIDTAAGTRIAVVDTGPIQLEGEGPPTANERAALEIWTPNGNASNSARNVYPLPAAEEDSTIGAPGRPALTPDGRYLYFASATGPYLFKFDLQERRWVRGTSNPIQVYETDQRSLNQAAIDSRGVLYMTAFNEDAMYLVDTTCDEVLAGPIPLGRSRDLLEGPLSLGIYEQGDDIRVYYNMSEANSLGYIDATY